MKIFIASDLHGSAEYCRQMVEAFANENADKLLLLGDVLYHGPRNDLPELYIPKTVVQMLDIVKDKIICVCGNCDAEIDREVLPFPVISDLGAIYVDGLNIYFAHGHKAPPILAEGDVYLTGHTHIPSISIEDGHYNLNPGSISIPKEGSKHGYIVYENRKFTFKDLSGEICNELEIKEVQPEEKVFEEAPAQEEVAQELPLQEEVAQEEVIQETPVQDIPVQEEAVQKPAAPRPNVIRRKFVVRRK